MSKLSLYEAAERFKVGDRVKTKRGNDAGTVCLASAVTDLMYKDSFIDRLGTAVTWGISSELVCIAVQLDNKSGVTLRVADQMEKIPPPDPKLYTQGQYNEHGANNYENGYQAALKSMQYELDFLKER